MPGDNLRVLASAYAGLSTGRVDRCWRPNPQRCSHDLTSPTQSPLLTAATATRAGPPVAHTDSSPTSFTSRGSLTSWPTAHAGWPPVLLIPGTSSVAHLRENVAGARIDLPADAVRKLSDGQGFLARPPNW
jgi:hypothetical protein